MVGITSFQQELAVRRLLDRYCHGCDINDPSLVAGLFSPGGTLVVRGASRSGSDLTEFYAKRLGVPSLHFVTGLEMVPCADGLIDSTCGFMAWEFPEGAQRVIAGRYRDVIEIVADGDARFISREIIVNTSLPLAPNPS